MSILLAFILYPSFLSGNARVLPLTDSDSTTLLHPRDSSPCNDAGNCRTIWDIIWSCLALIFTCNWVAIHPNVPGPDESTFIIYLRRAGITLVALIAPELLIMWALRQWFVARTYKKKYKESRGWTMTHGYFALMGGFMLFDGDRPQRILLPDDIDRLVEKGEIDFPCISEEEIEDKSKGDPISKGFVVLQTTWFIMQCIARGVQHLPITELEIVTLGYAVLNFGTYAVWWNKPLNVQRSFRIYKKSRTASEGSVRITGDSDAEHSGGGLTSGTETERPDAEDKVTKMVVTLLLAPHLPFLYMAGAYDELKPGSTRVPTYHVGPLPDGLTIPFAVAGIATIFGAIHCIAWSFHFPTHQERLLWRISSLALTCVPFPETIVASVNLLQRRRELQTDSLQTGSVIIDRILDHVLRGVLPDIAPFGFLLLSLVYICARLDLLVQAFISLRALPPGAFEGVQWTTFIPHI